MTIVCAQVPDKVLLFDCLEPVSDAELDRLAAAQWGGRPFAGCIRYRENLTPTELDRIWARKLGVMTVGEAPSDSMAAPSSQFGLRDAMRAVRLLNALPLPRGLTNWLDVEGTPNATHDMIVAYVNAWANVMRALGEAGQYDGWGDVLTTEQLYSDLEVSAYWASSPLQKAPAKRGWRLRQLVEDVVVAGVRIDVDEHTVDELGGACNWAIAA